jgi:hypothetical protein
MKRFRLWLVVIAVVLIILPSLAFPGDNLRPVRRSFFTLDPLLRADILALEAEKKENDLLKMAIDLDTELPFANDAEVWKTPNGGKWREIEFIGLTMSLSRFTLLQDQAKNRPFGNEDQTILPDLWPLLFRGSFQKGDIETLGDFFRPQLNLGIEF